MDDRQNRWPTATTGFRKEKNKVRLHIISKGRQTASQEKERYIGESNFIISLSFQRTSIDTEICTYVKQPGSSPTWRKTCSREREGDR